MKFLIHESDSGDELGVLYIDDPTDEMLIQRLCETGYLNFEPDNYILTQTYQFADGVIVIQDADTLEPLLQLDPIPDSFNDHDNGVDFDENARTG